jgi:hypothetical protein
MKLDTDDPFDMNKLALNAEQIAELAPFQKKSEVKPRRRSRTKFVMLPYEQTLAAAGHLKSAPLAVLVELAHQMFKTKKSSVTLTNSALRSVGVSYKAKLRTLRQLESAGMIKVVWRGRRRSPLVSVLWNKN